MGKASKAVKKRPPVASDGAETSDKKPDTMPEITTPKRGVTAPQLTSLVTLSVLASTFISLRRAASIDGVGSRLCSTTYADHEEGCTESDIFFVSLRHHRLANFVALYSVAILLTWSEPPTLQRLNHCLCASPVSATLASLTCHVGTLDTKFATATGLTYGALFVLTNNAYGAGMAPWRKTSAGIHDLTLCAVSLAAMGYGAYALYVGPAGVSDFAEGDVHRGSHAQLMFIGIEYLNIAVLAGFALFFLEDHRKRIMMFAMGLGNLFQIFYYLPKEKEHLLGVDVMNNVLFGSAVALLFFAMLPSAQSLSRGGDKSA